MPPTRTVDTREKPPVGIHRPLRELEVENWRVLVVAMVSTGQEQCLVWAQTLATLYSQGMGGLGPWPLKSEPKPQLCNLLLYQPPRAWGSGRAC